MNKFILLFLFLGLFFGLFFGCSKHKDVSLPTQKTSEQNFLVSAINPDDYYKEADLFFAYYWPNMSEVGGEQKRLNTLASDVIGAGKRLKSLTSEYYDLKLKLNELNKTWGCECLLEGGCKDEQKQNCELYDSEYSEKMTTNSLSQFTEIKNMTDALTLDQERPFDFLIYTPTIASIEHQQLRPRRMPNGTITFPLFGKCIADMISYGEEEYLDYKISKNNWSEKLTFTLPDKCVANHTIEVRADITQGSGKLRYFGEIFQKQQGKIIRRGVFSLEFPKKY
jgi:hypothetical protein